MSKIDDMIHEKRSYNPALKWAGMNSVGLGTLGRIEDTAKEKKFKAKFDSLESYLSARERKYAVDPKKFHGLSYGPIATLFCQAKIEIKENDDGTMSLSRYPASFIDAKLHGKVFNTLSHKELLKNVSSIEGDCPGLETMLKEILESAPSLKTINGHSVQDLLKVTDMGVLRKLLTFKFLK